MKELILEKEEINDLITGVKGAFSDHTQNLVLNKISFNEILGSDISVSKILELVQNCSDIYKSAVLKRIVAVMLILDAQRNERPLELKRVWSLIYESLNNLNEEDLVSSIGSQGFLSIPLFRLDKGAESFSFLRLHIWDDSFTQFIDKEKVENFSIHSHQFHANSWIIAGEVYNTIVEVSETKKVTDYNLFKIQWKESTNKVNQKTSIAVNTGQFVDVEKRVKEVYHPRDTYQIEAGQYHISQTNKSHPINSTLFLFSTDKSRVEVSNVLGPSHIKESEINRKIIINPKPLLVKLNDALSNG